MLLMVHKRHVVAAFDDLLRAQQLDRVAVVWLRWAAVGWVAVGAVSVWVTF